MKVQTNHSPVQPQNRHWSDGIKSTMVKALGFGLFLDIPSFAPPMKLEDAKALEELAEPGDIILSANKNTPLYQMATKAGFGSDWGHVSLYVGEGRRIDAGPKGVEERDVFDNGSHFALIKPKYKNDADRWKAVSYAYKALGTPYDFLSRNQGDSVTCTDLVVQAINQGDSKFSVDEGTLMGERLVTPDAFLEAANMEVVIESKNPWYKSAAGALPTIGLTAAAGVAGHMIGGWKGAIVGTVGGYLATTVAANIIQDRMGHNLEDRPWLRAEEPAAVEEPKVNASPNPVTVVETSCQQPGQSIELEGDCTLDTGGDLTGWKLAKTPSS